MSLTSQQEKFAQEVASGKSQSEAYRVAYPKALKWKPATIWNRASALMRNDEVLARVDALRAEIVAQSGVEAIRVIKELACIALSDVRKLFDAQGRLVAPHKLDDATAAAVASVELTDDGFKIKLWDKNSAADKLMKHLGAYEKDNKQGGSGFAEAVQLIISGVKPSA